MDFGGALSMDGLVSVSSLFSSDSESSKQKGLFGSGFSKHGRCNGFEENEWTRFKMAATSSKEEPHFLRSSCSHSLFPDGGKMLSFSSTKPNAEALNTDWALQFHHHPSTSSSASFPYCLRNSGMGLGRSNVDMLGIVAGMRGPFTPTQRVELEHQVLIYMYIDAKVPVPSSLLIPNRRTLNPSLFPVFSAESYNISASTCEVFAVALASFHPGFSGGSDPESGRCRRTDGKKWRCARDAVADQKYCERHLNRVRHRSRKHVEGRNSHGIKAAVPAITCSQSASAASGDNSSNIHIIARKQRTSFQPTMTEQSPLQLNRLPTSMENTSERVRNSRGLSVLPNLSPKPTVTLLPILKQQNPFEGTSARADFGIICTDSLVNPQGNSYSGNNSFTVPDSEINDQPSSSNYFRHFFNDLPNNPSDRSTMTLSDVDEMQSDRTQLSISIPMALSDNMSSSSSPNPVKHSISPLGLSNDLNTMNDGSQIYTNWVPISWEPSIGGPLGEVVTNKSITAKDLSRNLISYSPLNLLIDGWSSKPIMESSPTGVLQKTSFGSLSSSTGSSPRAEIENDERNET